MDKKRTLSIIIFFHAVFLLLGAGILSVGIHHPADVYATGLSREVEGINEQPPRDLADLQSAGERQLNDWAENLESFDGRKFNYITSEKNQGSLGICWAYAAIGAMEANILRDGVDPGVDRTSLDLDEIIAAYVRFNREGENDPLHLTTNDIYSAENWRASGGHAHDAFMAMSQGFSPDQQTVNNQGAKDWYIKQGISQSKYFVQGFKQIDHTEAAIKRAILEYGSVTMEYKSPDTIGQKYVYHEGKDLGHASLIVGWDDSISKTLFRPNQASSNGAWIVKNSWGYGGDGGVNGTCCFYLSYDAYMSNNLYVVDMGLREDYQNIYYYDGHITDNSNRSYAEAYGAIYQAKLSSATKQEQLSAVSFGLTNSQSTVDIEIYKLDQANLANVNDEMNKPDSGTLIGHKDKVYFEDDGFYTVDLDRPINLEQGEIFSIVISGKDSRGSFISPMIAFDNAESVNDMTYSRYDGQWTSFKGYKNTYADNSPGSCVRLRAITNLVSRSQTLDNDLQYARIDLAYNFVYYEKGKSQEPEITVYFDNKILEENEDYCVQYNNNVKPGTATIKISGMNQYSGERMLAFEIAKPKLPPGAVDRIEVYHDITRLRQVPLPKDWEWNEGDIALVNGDSGWGYSIKYIGDDADCYQKQTHSVHIYRHTTSRPETLDIADADVIVEGNYVYTGSPIIPKARVFLKGHELDPNEDYTLDYSENTNAGKAIIIVKGRGVYTGQATKEFEIKKAQWPSERPNNIIMVAEDVTDINQIPLNCSGWSWRVQNQKIEGDEFQAIAIYVGQGLDNYINTKMNITITRGTPSDKKEIASLDQLTLAQTLFKYNGTAYTPDVIARDGTYNLRKGTDYEVEYQENTNAGRAKAIIKGRNRYAGTITLYFTIDKADIQGFAVSQRGWTYGDEITPTPSIEGEVDIANVTFLYSNEENGTYTPDKPKNAGTYWIKAEIEQSQNYNSAVATSHFVIAKADHPDQMPERSMTIGRTVKTLQAVTLTAAGWQWEEPLTKIEAETIKAWAVYSDRENYDTYRIEITLTKEAPKDVSELSVDLEVKTFVYDGTEKTPKILAKDGESPLTLGVDYDVRYQNNKFAGQGNAIVTFKNDYKGTKELDFTIAQADEPSVNPTIHCNKKAAKLSDIPLPDGFVWDDESLEIRGNRMTAKAIYKGEDAGSYKTTEFTFEIIMDEQPNQPKQKNLIWPAIVIPVAVLMIAGIGIAIAVHRHKKN